MGNEIRRMRSLDKWVESLPSKGRHDFTKGEATEQLGMTDAAFNRAASRLSAAKRIARVRGGFYVVVPLEHSAVGVVPADWFVVDLMRHLGQPFYVGLLSAAEYHGAAHQRPQTYQVVTDRPIREIACRGMGIRFFVKGGVSSVSTKEVKGITGYIPVSTPEATAIDLLRYSRQIGGLGHVLTVLQELGEVLDAKLVTQAAEADGVLAYAQRLGWLLERTEHAGKAGPLAGWVANRRPLPAKLEPSLPIRGASWDKRWSLLVNAEVEGDLDITDNTVQVARLYQRKQATYSENRVYPWIQPSDLRADLIDRCRRHVRINRKNHPWADMDDAALLQSAQLVQSDPESGKSGVTLAGVMLFGHDGQIRQVCPAHRTDLLLRKVDVDRYDDRDLVITNLIDSYDRILAFVQKHLPDPFYLEGIERRSLRDHIFREVASNMLIHREYASGATSRLVIEYGRVVTDNPSRPHGFGILDPETCVPYQKNPILSAFFREIDRADELGSGMRKMMLYGKKYGGADPQLIEGDNFRMIISVPEFGANPAKTARIVPAQQVTAQVAGEVTPEVTPEVWRLLPLCATARTRRELQEALQLKDDDHFRLAYVLPALRADMIEMTLPDKPNSRLQKYRLTTKGRALLAGPATDAGRNAP
jgi:ATP-dependent DNA helicase RecG